MTKFTACLFKNLCQSLFLHNAVILKALKLVWVTTFFFFFSLFFFLLSFPNKKKLLRRQITSENSWDIFIIPLYIDPYICLSLFTYRVAATAFFSKMTANKPSQRRYNTSGKKHTIFQDVYLQVLGKLHALSELLGVMTAQSSEWILLDETSILTDAGFTKIVYKKMDQMCCELG